MARKIFLGFVGMLIGVTNFGVLALAQMPASAAKNGIDAKIPPVVVGPTTTKALSLTPDLANGEEIFGVCAGCHLPTGAGTPNGTFPQLAGQHKEVIIKQVFDIREGHRINMTMLPFAQSLANEQEVLDVSAYIQTLPIQKGNGVGPGTALAQGEKIYKENCMVCHGANGEGSGEKFYPMLAGQHYAYLLRQVNEVAEGKRGNADPTMLKIVQGLSAEDKEAVSDYASRLQWAERTAK